MALIRTLKRLGPLKAGVQPHLEIWWKKKPAANVTDGMVTQTISPFELKSSPMQAAIDEFAPAKFFDNFPNVWDIGPGIVLLVGTVYGADQYFEYLGHHHRD